VPKVVVMIGRLWFEQTNSKSCAMDVSCAIVRWFTGVRREKSPLESGSVLCFEVKSGNVLHTKPHCIAYYMQKISARVGQELRN
jgi:hypothetical protein